MDQKRDMDLIRLVLLNIEGTEPVDLSLYSVERIGYHQFLVFDAGLVKGDFNITQQGRDFLDEARDKEVWGKVKKTLAEKEMTVSFVILRAMLQKEIREQAVLVNGA